MSGGDTGFLAQVDAALRAIAPSIERLADADLAVAVVVFTENGPGKGKGDPAIALEARDRLLRELAQHSRYREMSIAGRGEKIAQEWGEYRARGWLLDRCEAKCPKHRLGKVEAYFWAMSTLGFKPLGDRRIRQILASRTWQREADEIANEA